MKSFFKDKKTANGCKIYQMLLQNAKKSRLIFHMPGHKQGKWDITELSYSDNLCAPRGCIAEAEREVSAILGAKKSFLLTDGSTSGVLSMLYAARAMGATKIVAVGRAHKSFFNGCTLVGITPFVCEGREGQKIPVPPTMYELKEDFAELLAAADALFITSPDYYGNVADWREIRGYCTRENKLLLVDGAHGGHLHFDKELYAGNYADMWVDGVHKSLPALTQGGVVSTSREDCIAPLWQGVQTFRTTSPSYPIMASVEYAVKYPQNVEIERLAKKFICENERIYNAADWTKLCAVFGKYAFAVHEKLESEGIIPEFCDGNVVQFYLSPTTKKHDFFRLKKRLTALFNEYPLEEESALERAPAPLVSFENAEKEWVEISKAAGRICAGACGLFPPCTPLIGVGEVVAEEKIVLLEQAVNVYGLLDGKILLFKNQEKEG